MSRIIAIASGKGGTGKTTMIANIGAYYARAGEKILLLDMDNGLRNLDILCDLQEKIVYDILDVIEGVCSLEQAILPVKGESNLFYLPATWTRSGHAVHAAQLKALCVLLRNDYSKILIDCPAGLGAGFQTALQAADEALLVTLPDDAALRGALRAYGLIDAVGLPVPAFIINRFRPDWAADGEMYTIAQITEMLPLRLVGVIPESSDFARALREKSRVLDIPGAAAEAVAAAAQRLSGKSLPYPSYQRPGFWEDFRQFLRNRKKSKQ